MVYSSGLQLDNNKKKNKGKDITLRNDGMMDKFLFSNKKFALFLMKLSYSFLREGNIYLDLLKIVTLLHTNIFVIPRNCLIKGKREPIKTKWHCPFVCIAWIFERYSKGVWPCMDTSKWAQAKRFRYSNKDSSEFYTCAYSGCTTSSEFMDSKHNFTISKL